MHCSSEVTEGQTRAACYGTAILKSGDELPASAIVHKIRVFAADGFRRADFAGPIEAAEAAGIGKLGTPSMRLTHRAWPDATGGANRVQEKLMRHADIRTTMNIYGDAATEDIRRANGKVVQMVLRTGKSSERIVKTYRTHAKLAKTWRRY